MPREPLTDREWYLVRLVQRRTLEAVIEACDRTGLPGSVVAREMRHHAITGSSDAILRDYAGQLVKEYKEP